MNQFIYAFYFLNKQEQELYQRLAQAIRNRETQYVRTESFTKEQIKIVIKSILMDHPEFFWYEGTWKMVSRGGTIEILLVYKMEAEEIQRKQNVIEAQIEEILSGFQETEMQADSQTGMQTDSQTRMQAEMRYARYIYDWLMSHIQYDQTVTGQNMADALVDRRAVCKGISKAYQYLMHRRGIFSTLATGTLDGRAVHVWNLIEIGEQYYHVDVAAGYDNVVKTMGWNKAEIRFFAVSDDTILKTHGFIESGIPRLECMKDKEEM